ncbi:MAG: cation-translocating P-type ATPase [Promethearchaeota archaeon]
MIASEDHMAVLNPHNQDLEDLLRKLQTNYTMGLSKKESEERLERYGENTIPRPKGNFWEVYLLPLMNIMITIYLVMTGVLILLAFLYTQYTDDLSIWIQALQWLVIVLINFAIAIFQQSRAQKKIDALHKLSETASRVIRENEVIVVPTEYIVPGDILSLGQGDSIPADARLLHSANLMVNEASLTGESVPVTKSEEGNIILDPDVPISERSNMVYNGTFIQSGTAKAVVTGTGAHTEIGKISIELNDITTGEIPLTSKVNTLGKFLVLVMSVFLFAQIIFKIFFYLFMDPARIFLQPTEVWVPIMIQEFSNGIITAMAIIPINIPILTTIVLLTGVLAMAGRRVIIKNLSAVESLGRVSILCSDKTGTITRSQMTVKRIYDGEKLYGVTGLGYGPSGVIFPIEKKAIVELKEDATSLLSMDKGTTWWAKGSAMHTILISGYLNNDASLIIDEVFEASGEASWAATGSPTDAALLALFKKTGANEVEVRVKHPFVREYPFDSSYRRMTKVFQDENYDRLIAFTKGATEVILDRCTLIGSPNETRPITEEDKEEISDFVNQFAALGFRVISFTFRHLDELPPKGSDERDQVENNLCYLGFACLLDPPREGVKMSVEESIEAGVKPIMVTGDSPVTAESIAREVGILRENQQVHEGKEAATLSDPDFENTTVFARVSPQDKQVIVERYKAKDRVVAMTGDGVNDALALSMSDAGIAMGIQGTAVAKQAADLVITDDSFNSIVTGIREGRSLFQRIRIMIFFYLCVDLAEGLLYVGTAFIPNFYLLDDWGKIYVFIFLHSLPPLALIFDRYSPDIMRRKPIDTAGIFSKNLAIALIITALTLSFTVALLYFITYTGFIPVDAINQLGYVPDFRNILDPATRLRPETWAHAKARTMLHTTLILSESLLILSIRRMDKDIFTSIKEDSFWFVYLMVLVVPLIHIGIMFVGTLAPTSPNIQAVLSIITFDVILLNLGDWVICAIAAIIPILVCELYKLYIRRQNQFF